MKKVLGILAGIMIAVILFQDCQKSDFLIITGVVRDSITNQPVAGAFIFAGNNKYITTASDGTFTISGAQSGKINFNVSLPRNGYYSISRSVIISNDRVNKVDFALKPIPNPEIETGAVINITTTQASVTGSVKLKPGVSVSQYGHCWSNSASLPTLEESVGYTTYGSASGEFPFTSNLTGLQVNKIYYVRGYAITTAGIAIYGNSVAFMTSDFDINYGQIYYYPFNGNALDFSGNGKNLYAEMSNNYPINGPVYTTDRFGNSNSACSFTSVTGKFYGSGTPGLNDFTVSLWFRKTNVWESSEEHLFQIGDSYGAGFGGSNFDNRFYITQDANPQNFNTGIRINGTLGTDYRLSLNSYPTANEWHHLVAERSGSTFSLYMDGALVKSIPVPSDLLPPSVWFNIGGGWVGATGAYEQYLGDLDELRLYNRALSDKEIQYLYTH